MTNDDGRKLFIAFYMMPRWNGTNYSLNIILTRIRFSVVYGVCEPYPCLALPPPRSKCGSPLTKNCQDCKSIPKIKVLDSRKSRKILDLPAAVRPPWDFVLARLWCELNSIQKFYSWSTKCNWQEQDIHARIRTSIHRAKLNVNDISNNK